MKNYIISNATYLTALKKFMQYFFDPIQFRNYENILNIYLSSSSQPVSRDPLVGLIRYFEGTQKIEICHKNVFYVIFLKNITILRVNNISRGKL